MQKRVAFNVCELVYHYVFVDTKSRMTFFTILSKPLNSHFLHFFFKNICSNVERSNRYYRLYTYTISPSIHCKRQNGDKFKYQTIFTIITPIIITKIISISPTLQDKNISPDFHAHPWLARYRGRTWAAYGQGECKSKYSPKIDKTKVVTPES